MLPPAFIHPPNPFSAVRPEVTVRAAIARTRHLRKVFSGRSSTITCKEIPIFAERWGVHVVGTQWMFNYGHSTTSVVVQCVNLVDGSITGEMPVSGKFHSSTTIGGQIHQYNETLLAILCEETRDQERQVLLRPVTKFFNG